jgi:hypothetical protein
VQGCGIGLDVDERTRKLDAEFLQHVSKAVI